MADKQQKQKEYREELERQMNEKRERGRLEKEQRKREEELQETRIKKELEEKAKKFDEEKKEKEIKRKAEEARLAANAALASEAEPKRKGTNRGGSTGRTQELPNEISKKTLVSEFKETNLHEMIRTNQDWINTALSKEYVLYKRREEIGTGEGNKAEIKVDDPFDRQALLEGKVKKEVDHFKVDLMNQLNKAKKEAMEAVERREKAERRLNELKNEYFRMVEEEKQHKAHLEAALMKTSPGGPTGQKNSVKPATFSQTSKPPLGTQPLTLYSKNGPMYAQSTSNIDSIAQSIALDCHTHFVEFEGMDESEMIRLAHQSYGKVMANFKGSDASYQQSNQQSGGLVQSRPMDSNALFDGMDMIMKEFQNQQRTKSGRSGSRQQSSQEFS